MAETKIRLQSEADMVMARGTGRAYATSIGFSMSEATMVATAISEVARNILRYAIEGEIVIRVEQNGAKQGVVVIATDEGPGIANVEAAMQDGFSTARSLGLGLPGARRLMHEFEIVSKLGCGTTVTMKRWTT